MSDRGRSSTLERAGEGGEPAGEPTTKKRHTGTKVAAVLLAAGAATGATLWGVDQAKSPTQSGGSPAEAPLDGDGGDGRGFPEGANAPGSVCREILPKVRDAAGALLAKVGGGSPEGACETTFSLVDPRDSRVSYDRARLVTPDGKGIVSIQVGGDPAMIAGEMVPGATSAHCVDGINTAYLNINGMPATVGVERLDQPFPGLTQGCTDPAMQDLARQLAAAVGSYAK
jgi:hypothetical protein